MRESSGSTKPTGAMKVKGVLGASEGRIRRKRVKSTPAAHCRPVSIATSTRRSQSVHVGTRKMVNYA